MSLPGLPFCEGVCLCTCASLQVAGGHRSDSNDQSRAAFWQRSLTVHFPLQVAGGHGSPDGATSSHRHTPGCWAVAKSGIPPREPLFNATICRFPGQWGAEASARAFSFGTDGGVVPLEARSFFCIKMKSPGYRETGEMAWSMACASALPHHLAPALLCLHPSKPLISLTSSLE
jgi:hypothetical protein